MTVTDGGRTDSDDGNRGKATLGCVSPKKYIDNMKMGFNQVVTVYNILS